MSKLRVRYKNQAGQEVEREVTKRAYDIVGRKFGYQIIGEGTKTEPTSVIQKEMERLKAEKAEQDATKKETQKSTPQNDETQETPSKKKPGRKPKAQ